MSCSMLVHICPQLVVRFLADDNSWNENGTPNLITVGQMLRALSQLASDDIFAQPYGALIQFA